MLTPHSITDTVSAAFLLYQLFIYIIHTNCNKWLNCDKEVIPLWPSDAYMPQWIWTSLVQELASRLFVTKPSLAPVLAYCQHRNSFQWCLNQELKLFCRENTSENAASDMAVISFTVTSTCWPNIDKSLKFQRMWVLEVYLTTILIDLCFVPCEIAATTYTYKNPIGAGWQSLTTKLRVLYIIYSQSF